MGTVKPPNVARVSAVNAPWHSSNLKFVEFVKAIGFGFSSSVRALTILLKR